MKEKKDSPAIVSLPPRIIRVFLVGSTVGLCSPVFCLGGIAYSWFVYMPRTTAGMVIKYSAAVVVGGGFFKLMQSQIIPFLLNNSDIILPFAIANGVTAGFWFLVAEHMFGVNMFSTKSIPIDRATTVFPEFLVQRFTALHLLSAIPVMGPCIGGLTAITSPFLWPYLMELFYSKDLNYLVLHNDPYWIFGLYEWIAIPVGIPTGIIAGLVIELAVHKLVYGKENVSWQQNSLPFLLLILILSVIYFTFCKWDKIDYYWIERSNVKTGQKFSYNILTDTILEDEGKKGKTALAKLNLFSYLHFFIAWQDSLMAVARDERNVVAFSAQVMKLTPDILDPKYEQLVRKEMDLSKIDEITAYYNLLDSILYYKHHQIIKASAEEMKSVVKNMDSSYHLRRPDIFMREIEQIILLSRKISHAAVFAELSDGQLASLEKELNDLKIRDLSRVMSDASSISVNFEKKKKDMTTINVRFEVTCAQKMHDRCQNLLNFMRNHPQFVEKVFADKLNYTVTEKYVSAVKALEKKEEFQSVVKQAVFMGGLIGAVAVIAYILIGER